MIAFMREKISSFAWDTNDMSGINPQIITHKLNVDLSFKFVKHKRRTFAPKKNQTINKFVDRLMTNKMI